MKIKRILAMAAVIVLLGLYAATLIFAIIGNGHFVQMFLASLAATIALPILIHLFLMINNARNGKSVWDNPYPYKDKKD